MNKIIQIGQEKYNITSDDNYLDEVGNSFEPHMLELYSILVDNNDIVADIGANIGLASIWFSKNAKQSYAFEPSQTTFKILKENLILARADNVVASNVGIGSKNEVLTITFAKNNRSGAFVSDTTKLSEDHITEKINIIKLDDFFENLSVKPNFLKIDVEGYEIKVLEGAINLLEFCKPTVVMEMNAFCLNVLHRVCLPEFIDKMKLIFPFLYAIDANNKSILNLHVQEEAYAAMHHHIVHRRYPNLVGGFTKSIPEKLLDLVSKNSTTKFLGEYRQGNLEFKLTGWSDREPTHIWSEGELCSMEFNIPENTKVLEKLILKGFSNGIQRINFILNGKSIYKTTLTGAPQEIEIQMPSGAFKTGLNKIELELPDAKVPDNGDSRKLGFALQSIQIDSAAA